MRAAVAVREAAGFRDEPWRDEPWRDDGLRDALAREALFVAPPRAAVLLRGVFLAEDFAADLRAPVALPARDDALRPPALAVREDAAVLRLFAAVRIAAALRPPDLLALLLREAVRRLAVLPRLLEREPVFRAMVRYSMRWGRAIGRFEIRDYFTRACSAREHEC